MKMQVCLVTHQVCWWHLGSCELHSLPRLCDTATTSVLLLQSCRLFLLSQLVAFCSGVLLACFKPVIPISFSNPWPPFLPLHLHFMTTMTVCTPRFKQVRLYQMQLHLFIRLNCWMAVSVWWALGFLCLMYIALTPQILLYGSPVGHGFQFGSHCSKYYMLKYIKERQNNKILDESCLVRFS